jgi:crotonobetainyl-CoA:carnitine CoA-transferase CaiB-like acyl-CoA transferase
MKHRDELDASISQWTIRFDDYEAMRLLQTAGVPSGPSLDISRVFNESQLREGGYLKTIQMRDGESRDLPGLPWRFDGGQEPILTEAPVLGQHNEYVYQELLGLTEQEATRLVEEQVIY